MDVLCSTDSDDCGLIYEPGSRSGVDPKDPAAVGADLVNPRPRPRPRPLVDICSKFSYNSYN